MIKRAKTGRIEEMVDKNTPSDLNIEFNGINIKDVLDVPTTSAGSIDVDLDADDDDEIAVRV